jgi:hypothetical protein
MSQKVVNTAEGRDSFVYYEGHLASHPGLMVGKLVLNQRYLIFHIHVPQYAGVLQNGRLASTGKIIALPLERVIDVFVEGGVRSKKSRPNWKSKDDFARKTSGEKPINEQPAFLDSSERYHRLVVTVETENGVEVANFEVPNAERWEQSLRANLTKARS